MLVAHKCAVIRFSVIEQFLKRGIQQLVRKGDGVPGKGRHEERFPMKERVLDEGGVARGRHERSDDFGAMMRPIASRYVSDDVILDARAIHESGGAKDHRRQVFGRIGLAGRLLDQLVLRFKIRTESFDAGPRSGRVLVFQGQRIPVIPIHLIDQIFVLISEQTIAVAVSQGTMHTQGSSEQVVDIHAHKGGPGKRIRHGLRHIIEPEVSGKALLEARSRNEDVVGGFANVLQCFVLANLVAKLIKNILRKVHERVAMRLLGRADFGGFGSPPFGRILALLRVLLALLISFAPLLLPRPSAPHLPPTP